MWKGGVRESGAALLWVHPTWRLLPWRIHVHPHISGRLVSHCLNAASVPSRRKCRRALCEGPWRENGGNGPGSGRSCSRPSPAPSRHPPSPNSAGTHSEEDYFVREGWSLFNCILLLQSSFISTPHSVKQLDYNWDLPEFSFGSSKAINEKIWQAIKFFFGLELYASSFMYF